MKRKIVCLIMCVSLIMSSVVFSDYSAPTTASAASKWELENRIDELDKQIAENKKKLEELKGEKEGQQEYLDTLESQIKAIEEKVIGLQTQIGTIDAEIATLDDELSQLDKEIMLIQEDITATQQAIVATEREIAVTSENLSQRLRDSYVYGSDSTLKILMGADSLANFMTRLEMVKRSSDADKKAISDFRSKVAQLEDEKRILAEKESELEAKRTEISEKKAEKQRKKDELVSKQKEYDTTTKELESQYAEIEAYIGELDKTGTVYQNYIDELKKEKVSADAEIDRILSEWYATSEKQTTTLPMGGNAEPDVPSYTPPQGAGPSYQGTGSWYWPLGNASCYISSNYGNRDPSISGWGFHGGTDITGGGIYGKPVYATRAGKVITAVTSDSGYGIYVLIDHGDGYSSLYGHMSARYVSAGDSVSQGQQIGSVGSTGNSTGPHLHFEIRYYGEKQNPMDYVKKP